VQKRILLEAQHAIAPVRCKPSQKIIAADRHQYGSRPGDLES
jgi:hypothetical protein